MSERPPSPCWLGAEERTFFAWLHTPPGPMSRGVILCPPLGYEAWCSYQTFRVLAAQLADAGCVVLRIDYDGTGNSAGDYTDAERVAAWRGTIRAAVAELRRRGAPAITLVGLRFGASLALVAASMGDVDALVLWEPVNSGRRFARGLKALSAATGAADASVAADDGLLGVAGTVYTKDTLAEMEQIDLLALSPNTVRRVLLLHRNDREAPEDLAGMLRMIGVDVAVIPVTGTAEMLEVDNEAAQIPHAALEAIVAEVCPAGAHALEPAVGFTPWEQASTAATIPWREGHIIERPVRSDGHGLFGILGTPAHGPSPAKVVLMLNGGTEHQVGPGRVWVEFSRSLNLAGVATLRADIDGVGDSPVCRRVRTARSYDPEHVDDVVELIDLLRARGFTKVIVMGLCSGAWLALQAALRTQVDGVFAINAQLYWQQGDPVYLTIAESHERQKPDRAREAYWDRLHAWTALDFIGLQHPATVWLGELQRRRVPTQLVYTQGDEGIVSLRARSRRRLERLLRNDLLNLEELAGIDHGMHRFRQRPLIFERLRSFVDRV